MFAYINTKTFDYPRHEEDVANDPEGVYAEVLRTPQPVFDRETQLCYEGAPIYIDGTWSTVWVVRDMTPEEIQQNRLSNAHGGL